MTESTFPLPRPASAPRIRPRRCGAPPGASIPPRRRRLRRPARGAAAAVLAALTAGLVAAPAAALPVISELYYDAPGSDDGQLFVEIAGAPGDSLAGLVLEGVNGSGGAITDSIVLDGTIGADGLFVVADAFADGTTSVLGADLLANFDFQNGPDSVVLRDASGVLDAIGYGAFGAGDVFAGEGSPAPDTAAGSSLARVFANVDSDDNALDFAVLDAPTPGVAAFAPVPEPGTALLMGLGLAGLAAVRPRREPGVRREPGGWARPEAVATGHPL